MMECVAETLIAVFACFACCVALMLRRINYRLFRRSPRRLFSSSSSSAPPSSWLWTFVVCVEWASVVGLVVIVVMMEAVGRCGPLGLVLTKSLS